jgi:hypothetical protein
MRRAQAFPRLGESLSLALRGSSFCTTSRPSVRVETFVSMIQEHNQQIAIRSRPFEILREVKA